jgi:hypothetical protein
MFRGKVTNVTSAGVFVQTADFGTLGPLQWAGPRPVVGWSVLVADVGDASAPDLIVVGQIGTQSNLAVSVPNATNGDVVWQTDGSARWTFRKSADSEAGSNSGSNLALVRRSDAGSQLSLPIIVWRNTGKVTFGDVGTSAGLELGSSGPTITTGTGAPSHSAPNGSVYLRTDGTATTTLYVRASGAWSALS